MAALKLDGSVIARGTLTEHGGAVATTKLLNRHPHLTAVFASTLSQAVGALHAIRTMGLRVPDDISVLGYDDLPLADYLDPPLTTIAMPLLELGAAAVDAVVRQILGAPLRPHYRHISTSHSAAFRIQPIPRTRSREPPEGNRDSQVQ